MAEKLKIIPLGGLDEIGKNMTVLEYGKDMIVIDCGVGFPDEEMYGVDLMLGAEINILDAKGNMDADEALMKRLDIRIAGIHLLCYEYGTKEENTFGMIQAIRHPYIQIISHPGDGTAELDFEPIVQASKECGTLLEINNSSLKPARGKQDARVNNLEILRLCKQYEVPVILGSDAHISFDIANYQYVYELLHETEFPEALIVNRSVEVFRNYLKKI